MFCSIMSAASVSFKDVSSLSNFRDIVITSAALFLSPDLQRRTVEGKVEYWFSARVPGVSTIFLDCKDLEVLAVTHCSHWEYGKATAVLGCGLIIHLHKPLEKAENVTISIEFLVTQQSPAITFLGQFCYTDFEPIKCRCFVPVQDSPSVRFPVKSLFKVAKPFTVVTGGVLVSTTEEGNCFIYEYEQKERIPSYLIGFAVGNFQRTNIGTRTWVHAEPGILQSAAFEFSELENYLEAAEGVLGNYQWGDLRLVVLPSAFPNGAIEGAGVIMLSPAVLTGNRDLVSGILHEIIHLWVGGLMTVASWEHLWIKEGMTVYFERKLLEQIYSKSRAEFTAIAGLRELENCALMLGESSNFMRLHVTLTGVDPEDAVSAVSYEKGYVFLLFLEKTVGEPDFIEFLKNFIQKYRFSSVDSYTLKSLFVMDFPHVGSVNWEVWLRGTGMPCYSPDYDYQLHTQVDMLLNQWETPGFQPELRDIRNWSSDQVSLLISQFNADPKFHYLAAGEIYGFSTTRNLEIKFEWVKLLISLSITESCDIIKNFLFETGRAKYILPIFLLLSKKEEFKETLEEAIETYHPLLKSLLTRELR